MTLRSRDWFLPSFRRSIPISLQKINEDNKIEQVDETYNKRSCIKTLSLSTNLGFQVLLSFGMILIWFSDPKSL